MKNLCPECEELNRAGAGQCLECDYLFVFRNSLEVTDYEWSQLIEELSDQDRLYFTTNQLFIHWQRPRVMLLDVAIARMMISAPLLLVCSLAPIGFPLLGASALSLLTLIPWVGRLLGVIFTWPRVRAFMRVFIIGVTISMFWWVWSIAQLPPALLLLISLLDVARLKPRVKKEVFMRQLQRWQKTRDIPMLLITPDLQRPKPELQGEALYDYEVREILIVDQDLTVDLLTYNHFLEEQHLILTSVNGYPEYSAAFTRRLLTLHDDVIIYLMHRDGHNIQEIRQKLRGLGVRGHRVVYLGWGSRAHRTLTEHLGFVPREWDAFAVDSLPPESLLEGLPIAIEDEISLADTLGPRLRIIS